MRTLANLYTIFLPNQRLETRKYILYIIWKVTPRMRNDSFFPISSHSKRFTQIAENKSKMHRRCTKRLGIKLCIYVI